MLKKWRTLSSRNVFQNRWISIQQETCEIHDGRVIDDYFIIEGSDIVIIFALTPDKKVVLVRQYKHGAGEIVTEIPAGGLEKDESPEEGARRELREETGYTAQEFFLIGTLLHSPTNRRVVVHIFFAPEAFKEGPPQFDDYENCETELATLEQIRQMAREGEIKDAASTASIYRVLDYIAENKLVTG